MSDTASDLASRAQAHDEVFRCILGRTADRATDSILDPEVFARVAGLLGYVKADGEEREWRRGGFTVPEDWFVGYPDPGFQMYRRAVGHGPWEVVTGADTQQ